MSYRSLIAQTEGVTGVTNASWFGALSQEPGPDGTKREEFFAQFATDIENYLPLYPELKIPPDQLSALLDDRMGCILGAKIAERLRKKVGDRLVLRSTIWTQKNGSSIWEFNVRAPLHNRFAHVRPDDDALPLQTLRRSAAVRPGFRRSCICSVSTIRAVPRRSPRVSMPGSRTVLTKRER